MTSKDNTLVFLYGNNRLACSIAVNLIQAEHHVIFQTDDLKKSVRNIDQVIEELAENGHSVKKDRLEIIPSVPNKENFDWVILLTKEELAIKKALVERWSKGQPDDTIIAVNTESIPLIQIQKGSNHPGRIVGLNWTEPAYNTSFLELIVNNGVNKEVEDKILTLSRSRWNKDPYVIRGELGIRSRIFASMVREAFYLVENGYASIADIDRAFRNDPGFYLPFCGNLRYMDLMGTYAYGLVMKELNPNLSKSKNLPVFFNKLIEDNKKGMETGEGFYNYTEAEKEEWLSIVRAFSFKIKELMDKYPFEY